MWAAVQAHVQATGTEVLLLDPLYLALGHVSGEVSNLYAVGRYLLEFTAACRAAGATVVFVHHTVKKAKKGAATDLADLAQAGVGEFARSWLLVGKPAEGKEPGTYRLSLAIGGSTGHASRWRVDLTTRRGGIGCWDAQVRPGGTAGSDQDAGKVKTGRQAEVTLQEGIWR